MAAQNTNVTDRLSRLTGAFSCFQTAQVLAANHHIYEFKRGVSLDELSMDVIEDLGNFATFRNIEGITMPSDLKANQLDDFLKYRRIADARRHASGGDLEVSRSSYKRRLQGVDDASGDGIRDDF